MSSSQQNSQIDKHMDICTFFLFSNLYLMIGVLLFSFSGSDYSQARIIRDRQTRLYWIFVCCVIFLWPVKRVIHHIFYDRIHPYFK